MRADKMQLRKNTENRENVGKNKTSGVIVIISVVCCGLKLVYSNDALTQCDVAATFQLIMIPPVFSIIIVSVTWISV